MEKSGCWQLVSPEDFLPDVLSFPCVLTGSALPSVCVCVLISSL